MQADVAAAKQRFSRRETSLQAIHARIVRDSVIEHPAATGESCNCAGGQALLSLFSRFRVQ
jgi:hypothetical protein